ncbi:MULTISPECIES: hypothetical protein [unclassified Agarivorans]|uniref:hypothetical protein n=1 Tax=unclassified Agarivorans TaxID=2636026 RepID=UPI0026E45FC5|nr:MULTISPECIES: hypothetical protein [unclassified Agarivorans]MDO6684358.1 hypothetical protein [Agarivorans sp. 3_MG-2023]MDO6714523.1 hypothetical protein [Agarivorans sp. 2_MG-2023]
MPTSQSGQYPLPRSDDEFEDLVTAAYNNSQAAIIPKFQRYGRNGQKQDGVDIICTETKTAIQCKLLSNIITKQVIDNELSKFKQGCFWPEDDQQKYRHYVFAVSNDRDTHIQQYIEYLSSPTLQISIVFWQEILNKLTQNQQLLKQFYPSFVGSEQTAHSQLSENDERCISQLIDALSGNRNHTEQASLFITENAHITKQFCGEFIDKISHIVSAPLFFQDSSLENLKRTLFQQLSSFLRIFGHYYSHNKQSSYSRIPPINPQNFALITQATEDLLDSVEPARLTFNALLISTAWQGSASSQDICRYYGLDHTRALC